MPDAKPSCMKRRVLLDLSQAGTGYVGIAQDTRMVFAMLAGLPNAELTGLLMPMRLHDLPRLGATGDQVALTAGILHWMSATLKPQRRRRSLALLSNLLGLLASRYRAVPVPPDMLDAVWRALFQQTLPPSDRAMVQAQKFLATDASVSRLGYRTVLPTRRFPVTLDVPGFDVAVFCDARPFRLPPGTQPVVRYHDAIPLTAPDTVVNWRSGLGHQRMVQHSDPRTWFVCNSPATAQDLLLADPTRERRTSVIPCALSPVQDAPNIALASVIAARRTFRSMGGKSASPPIEDKPRYVLAVSTFEPRKNFGAVIRAWERVTARHDPDLRLVFVAGKGWLEEDGFRLMAPYVAQGRIIHLQGLPPDELQAVMRGAECFAFPSFAEGFGYPPLEALQAGAPVIVSDIPVFRWTFGDAALFVDPYDVEALAQAMVRLCVSPDRAALRAELLSRRDATVARFQPGAVAGQWQALLDQFTPSRQ